VSDHPWQMQCEMTTNRRIVSSVACQLVEFFWQWYSLIDVCIHH